jgi:non-specific serine/threonine protein kinase/serine/threonine-protein kinase
MDTERVIARFELERQTLALLNHPSIAKVLDAGATDSGRPFFVMEFVEGETLNRYCDRKCLGIQDRLELFIRVCDGVQHAHQKGIIHRDLKPSNILVEEVDGQPLPKIIDFGIARATEQDEMAGGLTRFGEFVGTPSYMSPEQATAHADLDTRTDVYSLGVILYEIMVGSLPIDPESLRGHGLEGLLRALREHSPDRPSQRFTTVGMKQSRIAELRHTDPTHLRRQLRGDLDWIVMRALEKERERRYPSVSELGADIRRHLRHEPVLAGPPSVSYRARKFVRRHRVGVAAAGLVALSLVAGVIATTTAMVRALRAEREARIEAETATRVSDYLVGIFDLADPGTARGNTITAREILDLGVERIREELQGEPEVRAKLLETMGRVYRSLSLYDEARPLLEEALRVREGLPGTDPEETGQVLMILSGLLQKTGNVEEALLVAGRASDLCGEEGAGCSEQFSVQIATNIGAILLSARRYEEARPALLHALDLAESSFGADDVEVGKILINLGVLENRVKHYPDAVEYYRRALPIVREANGEMHPMTAAVLNNLGNAYKRTGDLVEARSSIERALVIHRKLYSADQDDLAATLNALAEVCLLTDDVECAVENAEESLAMRLRILGDGHRRTLASARTLYDAYRSAGKEAGAGEIATRYAVSE